MENFVLPEGSGASSPIAVLRDDEREGLLASIREIVREEVQTALDARRSEPFERGPFRLRP